MRILLLIIGSVLFLSCQEMSQLSYDSFNDSSILINTKKLNKSSLKMLEGKYLITGTKNVFGDTVVIKSNRNGFSIFLGKDINLMSMKSGVADSNIVAEGFWRDFLNYQSGGVRLFITSENGSQDIISGKLNSNIKLTGYITESGKKIADFSMTYLSPLNSDTNFKIIAHRGGGRNSDELPASENSLELLKMSESLGANAVEIDVRLTSDNIPVLFHDDFLSPRLINGDFLIGPMENYTYEHLQKFCTLKHGEKLPRLDEALSVLIDSTDISFVWLDVKKASSLEFIVPVVEFYSNYARGIGRNISIAVGLPDNDIKTTFVDNEYYKRVKSICELTVNDVIDSHSDYWAPSWTLGTQDNDVFQLKSLNKKSYVWTIDEAKYMRKFLTEGHFDGILTNYPAILVYTYYVSGK